MIYAVSPEHFIKLQISDIMKQIERPRTNRPEIEVPELVAELAYWHDKLREVEAIA
jgi:hypothetical protein